MRRLKRVKVVILPKEDPVVKTYEVKTSKGIPVEMPVREMVEVGKETKTTNKTAQNSYQEK